MRPRALWPSASWRGATVLDLGCGDGRVAIALAQRGYAVEGLDISPAMIEETRAAAGALGIDARFRVGDAVALPHEENELDAVVFGDNGIGHLTRDGKVACLLELARILKPGGVALLSLRTPYALNRMLPRLLRNVVLPRKGLRPDEERDDDQYVQRPPLAWLVRACREARLEPVCVCSSRQRRRGGSREHAADRRPVLRRRHRVRGAPPAELSSIISRCAARVLLARGPRNATTSSPRPWASAALRIARRSRIALA